MPPTAPLGFPNRSSRDCARAIERCRPQRPVVRDGRKNSRGFPTDTAIVIVIKRGAFLFRVHSLSYGEPIALPHLIGFNPPRSRRARVEMELRERTDVKGQVLPGFAQI